MYLALGLQLKYLVNLSEFSSTSEAFRSSLAVIHSEAPPVHAPRGGLWFAVSRSLMLSSRCGCSTADYNREWKSYQREFRRSTRARGEEGRGARHPVQEQQGTSRSSDRARGAQKEVASRAGDIEKAKAAVSDAGTSSSSRRASGRCRSLYFDASGRGRGGEGVGRGVPAAEKRYNDSKDRYESRSCPGRRHKEKDAADAHLRDSPRVRRRAAQITSLTETRARLQKKLQNFGPTRQRGAPTPGRRLHESFDRVRRCSFPRSRTRQLHEDPEVDRCTTCHLRRPRRV